MFYVAPILKTVVYRIVKFDLKVFTVIVVILRLLYHYINMSAIWLRGGR
jgi:hypothetical protein